MKVLVDTAIWSLALRRRGDTYDEPLVTELATLIEEGRVAMVGPVRQELLSGIRDAAHFDRLRDHLRAFADTGITVEDYEEAALLYNRCRAKGIQGSNTDFLICAVAIRKQFPIFTTDADFVHFTKVAPLVLYQVR